MRGRPAATAQHTVPACGFAAVRAGGGVLSSCEGGHLVSVSVSSIARRLTGATAVAAAVVGAVALPAVAAGHHPGDRGDRVIISGVQYDAPGWDNRSIRSLNKEWVEITNTGRHDVNLDGWTLSNEDGRTYTFRHFWLDGHATVRVHTGVGRDGARDVYQDRRDHVWDNHDGTATLRTDRGRFVDEASWSDGRRHHGNRHDRDHDGRR